MAKDCEYLPIVMLSEQDYVAGVTCDAKLAIQGPPASTLLEAMERLLADLARTLAECFAGSMNDEWTQRLPGGSLIKSQRDEQSEGRESEYEHGVHEGETAGSYTDGNGGLRSFDYGHDEEVEMSGAGSLGSRGHPGRRGSEMMEET